MKLKEVVERAMKDDVFADELRCKAQQALDQGIGSQGHEDFFRLFAEDDTELGQMIAPDSCANRIGTEWKAALTTTPDCATTTTTTTTTTVG